MTRQNLQNPLQVPLFIFISPWSTNAEYFKFCHQEKKRLSEGFKFKKVKANKASHIISNIILIFPLAKEDQAKYHIFKNHIKYLIKVL